MGTRDIFTALFFQQTWWIFLCLTGCLNSSLDFFLCVCMQKICTSFVSIHRVFNFFAPLINMITFYFFCYLLVYKNAVDSWNPAPLSKFTYSGNLSGDSVVLSVCTVSSIYSIIIYVCNEFFVSFPVLTLLTLVRTPSTMPGGRADSGSLLFPCFKRKASTYPVLKEVVFYFAKSLCVCVCV